jgi:heptosyltransferase-2
MKILVAQLSFLGDGVLSTPVMETLAAWHPEAEIWVLTTPAAKPLFAGNKKIAGIVTFDKRKAERGILGIISKAQELSKHRFDIVFSLHRHLRTALLLALAKIPERIGFHNSSARFLYTKLAKRKEDGHEVERNLSILSAQARYPDVVQNLFLPEYALESKLSKKYCVFFPGSVWATKRWAASQFRQAALELHESGFEVVILGSQEEIAYNLQVSEGTRALDLTGKTALPETMSIVRNASGVVSNDSMGLHLASAYKVPVVAIFCATVPEFGYGPWQTVHEIAGYDGLWCRPCARHGGKVCPTGTELCMQGVPARQVVEAAKRIFKQ